MNVECKNINNVLHIYLQGELDEYTAKFTREILDSTFLKEKFNEVIFDFENLEFMDSTGIGVLIGRYKNLKSRSKGIYIMNPNPTIEKIMKMSGIYEIMPKIS
ncbi:MAG: STAS domain-containing protein [Clostridia bacterium]|nr:STAS domain-containing protein [Clostridia bacterium]